MNAKIQKLMDRSFTDEQGEQFDPERFVQLIIKESITVMEQHDYHGTWLGEKLKKHFGVEE